MNQNKIGICDSEPVHPNSSAQTSITQSRTLYERYQKSKMAWNICFSISVILIILAIVIPIFIVVKKQKDMFIIVTTTTTMIGTTATFMTTTTTGTLSTSMMTTGTTAMATRKMTTIAITQVPISLAAINNSINGVYNTIAGGNSMVAIPYSKPIGQYPENESPDKALDRNISTKHLTFGTCSTLSSICTCGLQTGFYLELKRGASLVTGLQLCTGNDHPERDPIQVTLEGSNQSGAALAHGASWILIYNGVSGLTLDPDRNKCGVLQTFENSMQYSSYRFLVSQKRFYYDCVQYSELRLFGS